MPSPSASKRSGSPGGVGKSDSAKSAQSRSCGTSPGDAVIICPFELRGHSRRPWALGLATYPVDAFNDATRALLLDAGFVDDDQLERVSGRRLVGYHERISARLPTAEESDRLEIAAIAPILTLARTARTTTTPISRLAITARTDRLEVDYLVEP